MKWTLLLIASAMMLCSIQAAWTPFVFQNGHDMLEYMRDEDHYVYVLFIYNSDQDSAQNKEKMRKIVMEERVLLKTNILDAFGDIKYAELDLAGGQWDEVCHEIGIETDDALEYPIVVAVDDGIGKWVHGPDLIQLAVPVVRALTERNKQ